MDITQLEKNADRAAALLTAMASPKRLLVLCNLVDGERTVTELAERVGLGQSPLSQHLAKLRAWQLVNARRDGQSIRYSLASAEVRRLLETLYEIYCEPGPKAAPSAALDD